MMDPRANPETWNISISLINERLDLGNASVLDIGFGSGGFLLALAQKSKIVTGVDISPDIVKKMRERIRQQKQKNIRILCESAVNLPFENNVFDLIILNGVLEYTAQDQKGPPKDTHIKILKHIRKMLKPRGLFYLGIENRYYLKFILGHRDHYEMRFSNVLPRNLSKFISKNILKKEARNHIYSYNEYVELLGEAGFNDPLFFTALPNYKAPEYIIPIENIEDVREAILKTHTKKLYQYVCYSLALSKYLYKKLGPDFVIISMV